MPTYSRGVYSNKNKLNDLTGKEWKFATRSVINKPYPVDMQHKLRSQHGGQKPPRLCADLIKIFTKKGQIVLDPLAGVGGTLLGASLCGRRAIGIEINPRWVQIYKTVCELENLEAQEVQIGDSAKLLKEYPDNCVHFLLTDVPYWHMDKVEKTRSKRANRSKLNRFDKQKSLSKREWLDSMALILHQATRILKPRSYMAIFVGDMYRGSQYHMLSADLASRLATPTLVLKANLIWYDVSKSLHVFGYPYAFVPSMVHQNILIFRKEQ